MTDPTGDALKAHYSISGVRTRFDSQPVLQIIEEAEGKQVVIALVPYSDRRPKDHALGYKDANMIVDALNTRTPPVSMDEVEAVLRFYAEEAWFNYDWPSEKPPRVEPSNKLHADKGDRARALLTRIKERQ